MPGPLRFLPSGWSDYDSLVPVSLSVSNPNEGVMPSGVSITGAGVSTTMPADVPVRVVPVRALLLRVRDAVFFRRAPPARDAVFLRPVERDAVFLRVAVFLRAPERDAVFLRAPEDRKSVV